MARDDYAGVMRRAFLAYRDTCRGIYAGEGRRPEHPFWRERRTGAAWAPRFV